MPSENNHIDNFLRNKASEATVDASRVDAHWQQMKEALLKPSNLPSKQPLTRTLRFRKYLPYAAGVIMVVTTVTIMVLPKKKNNRKTSSSSVVIKKTDPVKNNGTVTIGTVPPKKVVTKTTTYSNDKAPVKKQPVITGITKKKTTPVPLKTNTSPGEETNSKTLTAAIKPDSKTIFNNFYNELKKEKQEFVINVQHDTLIRCKEGSSVFIPAGAFQTVAGLAITGTVRISIQEFYSFADIISNKLSTTSNSMPLETGGMLFIDASTDNNQVMIRPNASLDLKMPTRAFDPEMQLFTGQQRLTLMDTVKAVLPAAFAMEVKGDTARVDFNRSAEATQTSFNPSSANIDWIPGGQKQFFFNEKARVIKVLNLHDGPYIVRHTGGRTIAKFVIPFYCKLSTSEIEERLRPRYTDYDVIKVKRAWKRRPIVVGEVSPVMVGDSTYISLQNAVRLKVITRQDSIEYEKQFRKQYEDAVKQQRSYDALVQKRDEYNFKITNLGWINCDRFLNYPRSRLTDYVIHPGAGFEGTYFQSLMIFEKEKAVMPGYWHNGSIGFSNLPVGHVVHVICAGVKDGKMYSCVQTIEVLKNEKPEFSFEETSPQQFKEKLAKFGNVKSM